MIKADPQLHFYLDFTFGPSAETISERFAGTISNMLRMPARIESIQKGCIRVNLTLPQATTEQGVDIRDYILNSNEFDETAHFYRLKYVLYHHFPSNEFGSETGFFKYPHDWSVRH